MTENQEIRINTNYGKIALKAWGTDSETKKRLLCVHGWMDNAGSFDRLLPLLDLKSVYVLCIDLPGHGFSSHLPNGSVYSDQTWVLELKRVIDYLKWTKFSILAHSMGANASLNFANLFPNLIEKVITLDTVKPAVFPTNELASRTAHDIQKFIDLEERYKKMLKREPVFTFDTAISALKSAHSPIGELSSEGASCLLKRATKIATENGPKGGYIFTRDYRLQCVMNRKTDCQSLLQYFSGIKCELLIINAKNGLFTDRELQKQFLELYSKNCKKFFYLEVEGDHYLHLTRPLNIAKYINNFLNKSNIEINGE